MKKIRKKEPSVGILGKIVNLFSSSKQDTYSADYLNNKLNITHYANGAETNINQLNINGVWRIYIAQGSTDHNYLGFYGNTIVETFVQAENQGCMQRITNMDKGEIFIRYAPNITLLSYDNTLHKVEEKNTITVILRPNYTISAVDTYEVLPLKEYSKIGDKLTLMEDGKIKIGEGISKIKIDAKVAYDTVITDGIKWSTIRNNETGLIANPVTVLTNERVSIVTSSFLANVKQNDKISLAVYSNSLDMIRGLSGDTVYTYLTVEVVE